MLQLLKQAIEKVKDLPEDRQAYAAEVLEHIAAEGSEIYTVPEEHRLGIAEGLAEARRGEFASDEEMEALWARCGR